MGITTVTSADSFIGFDIVQRVGARVGNQVGLMTVTAEKKTDKYGNNAATYERLTSDPGFTRSNNFMEDNILRRTGSVEN